MAGSLWARKPVTTAPASGYRRTLGLFDLTNIGIAAIIGAGIFVFLGQEAINTGPAVVISLALAGFAAALAALSYAEASAILPGSGGAYAFAYSSMGNLPAFMMGWLFVNGYVIGNAGVATGWATFFVSGMEAIGVTVPEALTKTPFEGGIINLPSVGLLLVVTGLAMLAMRESTRVNNLLVVLKLGIVLFVIIAGAFLVKSANWQPFSPAGTKAIAGSTVVLFFAYLGFDTIAATGSEAKEPKRHLPIAILVSIGVCTLLYILMAFAVTGMAPSSTLDGSAPVADAFSLAGQPWAAGVITVGALIGLMTVAYAFHVASARIFHALATDGFFPAALAKLAPNGVPQRAAILVGVISMAAAGFVPLDVLIETSVEANIAIYILVSLGILVLRKLNGRPDGFSVPAWLHALAIVALASVVVFGIQDPRIHLVFVGWIGIGLILYGFWAHASSLRVQQKAAS